MSAGRLVNAEGMSKMLIDMIVVASRRTEFMVASLVWRLFGELCLQLMEARLKLLQFMTQPDQSLCAMR